MNKVTDNGFLQVGEITKFLRLDRFGRFGNVISSSFLKLMKIDELNKAYAEREHLNAVEFIDAMFDYLGVRYTLSEKDKSRIPKSGPFIVVANHPLGGIDGMIMIKTILSVRQDFKIMANFLLNRVKPLQPYILSVNPFEDHKEAMSNIKGLRTTLAHLKEGNPLGIFPAGEVSTIQPNGEISDKPWDIGAIKLIKKANVRVIPVYFEAKNSTRFYRMSRISSALRTALLPAQMTSQHKREIVVRIGNPIFPATLDEFNDINSLSTFLREKTYFLSRTTRHNPTLTYLTYTQPIADEVEQSLLVSESKTCKKLFTYKQFDVIIAEKNIHPNLINEIGRQREIVFRQVGEGTNKPLDLDKYDNYYKHLVIFDTDKQCIAGAYRIGVGSEIYKRYGLDGFYLNEFFEFEQPFIDILRDGIELGRAFVVKEYQKAPMSLFILWKGITIFLLEAKAKYIVGGVSISNTYTSLSKSIIVKYMKSQYYDHELAKSVKAKMEFKPELSAKDSEYVQNITNNDIMKVDKLIDELEPNHNLKIPVLLKKYVKQNAKLVAFNIDPNFGNTVDGLMYACIDELPHSTIQSALDEIQKQQK